MYAYHAKTTLTQKKTPLVQIFLMYGASPYQLLHCDGFLNIHHIIAIRNWIANLPNNNWDSFNPETLTIASFVANNNCPNAIHRLPIITSLKELMMLANSSENRGCVGSWKLLSKAIPPFWIKRFCYYLCTDLYDMESLTWTIDWQFQSLFFH